MKKTINIIFLVAAMCLQVVAQDSTQVVKTKKKLGYLNDDRHWEIEIPIWIPGFRGEFYYGDVGIEGEDGTIPKPEHPIEKPGFGGVFKRLFKSRFNLNYFFVFGVAYDNEKIFAEMDAFTGSLNGALIFRTLDYKLVSGSVHTDLGRINVGYNIFERPLFNEKGRYQLYPIVGTRIHNFYVKVGNNDVSSYLKLSPTWFEPVAGFRNEFTFTNFEYMIQGDIGSFWIKDKISYHLNMHVSFRASNLVSIKLGWNSWYSYYRDKFRDEDLRLKVHLAGPITSVTFNF